MGKGAETGKERQDRKVRFTDEELKMAKEADLCAVAESLGYTVKRAGRYHTLEEMDSVRIYNRRSWFRWSRQYDKGENGGSQIDFLCIFAGMGFKEAIGWLLDFEGYRRDMGLQERKSIQNSLLRKSNKTGREEKKPFILPVPAGSNYYLYSYLEEKRGIAKPVIDTFVNAGLVYEAGQYHNIVFIGKDTAGRAVFASLHGVSAKDGWCFKCDVAGSDKNYGFNFERKGSRKVMVFEAAIDLMSYITLFPEEKCHMLALGMLSDAPLATFLNGHPGIGEIQFCLDNDVPGRKAAGHLMEKYYCMGYEVEDFHAPVPYKDINEWLVAVKTGIKDFERKNVPVKTGKINR